MSDVKEDVSKLFPFAATLLGQLQARAVIVLAYESAIGASGCAPAFLLGRNPEDAPRNTKMMREIARILREVADRVEIDIRASGVPLDLDS